MSKKDILEFYKERIETINKDIRKCIKLRDWNMKKALDFEKKQISEEIIKIEQLRNK
ncbi:MAG: hypothetical protein ACLR02_15185 [Clostridium sp.]|nr:MAG TPA: hypothetical protein [Caudoviricetes sp.]